MAVDRLGDLEWGMIPSEFLPSGGERVSAQWTAVSVRGVLFRSAIANVGMDHDKARPLGLAHRFGDRQIESVEIVDAAHPGRNVPTLAAKRAATSSEVSTSVAPSNEIRLES